MKKESVREQVRSYVIITLACVLYALSFNWFYAPNDFTVGASLNQVTTILSHGLFNSSTNSCGFWTQ